MAMTTPVRGEGKRSIPAGLRLVFKSMLKAVAAVKMSKDRDKKTCDQVFGCILLIWFLAAYC
jgi:hypothetical protein